MGERLRLRTEAHLAAGGDAVARHPDGRVVFVVGAAPDEEVDVEVRRDNPRFLRAEVISVVTPGPSRVEPGCAHVAACGGCTLQHVDPAAQVASKQAALRETLARIGHVDPDAVEIRPPWSGPPFGYRTRARLAWDGGENLGYRAGGSRRVVDVDKCPVLAPELQDALTALRSGLRTRRSARQGRDLAVSMVSDGEGVLLDVPPGLTRVASQAVRSAGVPIRFGDDAIATRDDGFGPLLVSPRVFAQASHAGNAALVAEVQASLPEGIDVALDLYAGTGNFTRVLAPRAGEVHAFEGAREAVSLARRHRAGNVTVHLGAVAPELRKYAQDGGRADLVLLDPPRTGAEPDTLEQIARLAPSHVVYVSCNPATFARDLGRLDGYRLTWVRLFDLYPQTGHVELVGGLTRAG